jgi:signal transduction histidine kinase
MGDVAVSMSQSSPKVLERSSLLSPVFGDRYTRYVNVLRFVLPILLFVVANGFELYEHWGEVSVLQNYQLLGEILVFGMLGPLLVFAWLSYIGVLIKRLNLANKQMASLNQNLERQVMERTAALAQRNEELARMNKELQRLDQLKSDFVSLVSHELRAPLTTLNGAIEMTLHSSHPMPPQSQRMLEVMASESSRLTRLVQTILDISRLEAGKITFNFGPVALKPVVARCVNSSLDCSNRPIFWATETGVPPAWADEIYLEEVVRNLLVNADKYSPAGKPVEIGIHRSAETQDCLQIVITDHGTGIPPDEQQRVFERFHRRRRNEDDGSSGWGLGLYFARMLTEAQNGILTVKSPVFSDDRFPGAQFTITLPVAKETLTDA